ncbi:MAG: Ig-like domain-containing protein [Anaerolineae bacterium]|nr:Ig-like domain-containing protein [Anaerolineae bacterium]
MCARLYPVFILVAVLAWVGCAARPAPRVVALEPADGAAAVPVWTDLRLTLAAPPVVLPPPPRMDPPVAGAWQQEGNTLVFRPSAPLAADTAYSITVTLADRTVSWHFRTRPLRLLYLAPDAQGHDQLVLMTLGSGRPITLTATPEGIWDYGVASRRDDILFATLRADGGSDIWRLRPDGSEPRRVLACPRERCSGAVWSPRDNLAVYERRRHPGDVRLWWLHPDTGATVAVFDGDLQGFAPRFSADGAWLSFVEPGRGLHLYRFDDGRHLLIPGESGEPGSWRPNGEVILFIAIQNDEQGYQARLMALDLTTGQLRDLGAPVAGMEDSSPAWSPDASHIVLTRSPVTTADGAQVWLLRPDGSEARPLTDEPDFHHSLPLWSPDGRWLVGQRFAIAAPEAQPEIWLLEVATGTLHVPAAPARWPAWLP